MGPIPRKGTFMKTRRLCGLADVVPDTRVPPGGIFWMKDGKIVGCIVNLAPPQPKWWQSIWQVLKGVISC